jgi:hypothetical protein
MTAKQRATRPFAGEARRRRRAGRAWARFLAVSFVLAGCDTRVVELLGADASVGAPDASVGMAGCREFVRDDGVTCVICFDETGAVQSIRCPQPQPQPPASPTPPPAPVEAVCRVVREGDDRCALCPAPMTGVPQMTCLKCDMPVPDNAGGQCRVCTWSDDPNLRCLQCFDRAGTRREDSCDRVRRETFVYPPPATAADAGSLP